MTRKSDMDELTLKTGAAVVAVQAMFAAMAAHYTVDKRASAVARTQFETAFPRAANPVHADPLLEGCATELERSYRATAGLHGGAERRASCLPVGGPATAGPRTARDGAEQ